MLLRMMRTVAKTGQRAFFGAAQNPPQQPWKFWGPPTDAEIIPGVGLRLYDGSDWFSSPGGLAYEIQPLTKNWGYEMTLESDTGQRKFYGYIGLGWTSNQDPGDFRYLMYFMYGNWETGENDTEHYGLQLILRDKNDLLSEYGDSVQPYNATTMADPHVLKLRMIDDNTIAIALDGIYYMCYPIPATGDKANFRTGPGKRALNFRQVGGYTDIKAFYVYDYLGDPFAGTQTLLFGDNFNRADGAPGNGWTTSGSNFGIVSTKELCINGFFPSAGYRAIWRTTEQFSSGKQIAKVQIGDTDDSMVKDDSATYVILRMNPARTLGIAMSIERTNIEIYKFTGTMTSPVFTLLGSSKLGDNEMGDNALLEFHIANDTAKVWTNRGTGGIVTIAEGIDAHSPPSNTGYGMIFRRNGTFNSASISNFEVYNLV